jgi:hypothetical protein
MGRGKGRKLRVGGGSQQECCPGFRGGLTRKGQRTKRNSGEGKSTEVEDVVAVFAVAGVAVVVAVVAAGVAVVVVAVGVAVAVVAAVVSVAVEVVAAVAAAVAAAIAVAVAAVAVAVAVVAAVAGAVAVAADFVAGSDSVVHPEVSDSAQVRSLDKFVRSENGADENKLLAVVCDGAAVGVTDKRNCCIQQHLAWEGA